MKTIGFLDEVTESLTNPCTCLPVPTNSQYVPPSAVLPPTVLTTNNTGIIPFGAYFTMPRFSTSTLPKPSLPGAFAYNITTSHITYWNGIDWIESMGAGGSNTNVLFNDNSNISGNNYFIYDKVNHVASIGNSAVLNSTTIFSVRDLNSSLATVAGEFNLHSNVVTGTIEGISALATYTGTTSRIGDVIGIYGQASTNGIGILTVPTLIGLDGQSLVTSDNCTVPYLVGSRSSTGFSNGIGSTNINQSIGLHLKPLSVGSSLLGNITVNSNYGLLADVISVQNMAITNNYGVYIADQNVVPSGTTITNNYNLYSAGRGQNYFGGKTTIDHASLYFNRVATGPFVLLTTTPTGVGLLTGTYSYNITFVTDDGKEAISYAYVTSPGVTLTNQQCLLGNLPISSDPKVVARKVYRNKTTTPSYQTYYVGTIPDNVTTTYVDNVADSSLGAEFTRLNYTGGIIYANDSPIFVADDNIIGIGLQANSGKGQQDIMIGWQCGNSLTSYSHQNIGMGAFSLFSATDIAGTVAIGSAAGYSITTGHRNTFIGLNSGFYTTTSYGNTYMGEWSGFNMTGSYNVAIGSCAGQSATTGDNNIFIGHNSGNTESGSNKLYINSSNTEISSPLIYGDFLAQTLTINGVLTAPSFTSTVATGTAPFTVASTTVVPNLNSSLLGGNSASYFQPALGYTAENAANKSTSIATDATSDTKYPSVKAVKTYADGLVTGLLDYRGVYDASSNTYPASGGSGLSGAVLKGDMWVISVAGTLGGSSIQIGDSIIANIDTPGQVSTNWNTLNTNITYAPEDSANKVTSLSSASTNTQYPSAKLLYDQLATKQPTGSYLTAETDPVFSHWLSTTPPLYTETDPVFSAWKTATPPLYAEADTLATVTARGASTTVASTFSSGLIAPKLYPSADSTTAVQINKADGVTNVVNVDTTNGRVGIGITPTESLHVSGAIKATSYVGGTSAYFTDNYATSYRPRSAGENITFKNYAGTALATMLDGGNVGIGTTSPTERFDVVGAANTFVHSMTTGSASKTGFFFNYNSIAYAGMKLYYNASDANIYFDDLYPYSSTNQFGNIIFRTTPGSVGTQATAMTIQGGGNVGIGTTSPGAKLQIDSGAITGIGVIVKGYAGQTANLQEWQDSTGAVKANIGSTGALGCGGISQGSGAVNYAYSYDMRPLGGSYTYAFAVTPQTAFAATTGTITPYNFVMTYNHASGTSVANTDLLINRTETNLGTTPGAQLLIDAQVGGVSKFKVDNAGKAIASQYRLSALNTTPSSATDTGTLGEIRYDADYMYVCTATNTWKRSAISTW